MLLANIGFNGRQCSGALMVPCLYSKHVRSLLHGRCWSSSLDNVMRQYTEKSTKYWFSIYQLIQKYLDEQKMETSTGRMVLIDSFLIATKHCSHK